MFGKMRMTFSRRRTSWMSRCGTLGRSESLAILLRQSQHGCCFNLSTKKPPRSDGERWLDAALCRDDFALLVEHDIPVEPSRPTLLPEAPSKPPVFFSGYTKPFASSSTSAYGTGQRYAFARSSRLWPQDQPSVMRRWPQGSWTFSSYRSTSSASAPERSAASVSIGSG
jgi:hypothetical protein